MKRVALLLLLVLVVVGFFIFRDRFSSPVDSSAPARDPGVRTGAPSAGVPIAGLTEQELEAFGVGKEDFEEEEDVADGLGPTMNLGGCSGCHQQPSVGGTSPPLNPQIAFANFMGAINTIPPFIARD